MEALQSENGRLRYAQRRIGRKTLGKRILNDVPVRLIAYDLLESGGMDVRRKFLSWHYVTFSAILDNLSEQGLMLSPGVTAKNW